MGCTGSVDMGADIGSYSHLLHIHSLLFLTLSPDGGKEKQQEKQQEEEEKHEKKEKGKESL
jgi:hypothetical protein